MKVDEKAVRQSLSLPPRLAKQVGSMAKSRKLSKNRMLLALIENGISPSLWPPIQWLLTLPTWLVLVPPGLLLVLLCRHNRRG
jgi:hypothetical protein